MTRRPLITLALAGTATIVSASFATAAGVSAASTVNNSAKTTLPIKHVVVLFQENVSFDHYFGTYPKASNADGQPFKAKPGTPTVNGLTPALLTANPNGVNPKRTRRGQRTDVRPGSRLHTRAAGAGWGLDGQVPHLYAGRDLLAA